MLVGHQHPETQVQAHCRGNDHPGFLQQAGTDSWVSIRCLQSSNVHAKRLDDRCPVSPGGRRCHSHKPGLPMAPEPTHLPQRAICRPPGCLQCHVRLIDEHVRQAITISEGPKDCHQARRLHLQHLGRDQHDMALILQDARVRGRLGILLQHPLDV
jgi:hypothetical protein